MPDAAIEIQNVNKSYGTFRAVRDLSLAVPRGSICGFLGPNGAGKSTTIRMVMSISCPDSGTVRVMGKDALTFKDRIGYLPEERGVYAKMQVSAFLEYMAGLKGMKTSDARSSVDRWLKRMGLFDARRKKCQELSKGMQQKVQFIASVVHGPELLILDEPFSGLDPVNAVLMTDVIREINRGGTTIIYSTHVLHQAEALCDRFFLINKGVKLLDATLAEIHAQFDPKTLMVEPVNGGLITEGVAGIISVRKLETSAGYEVGTGPGTDPQTVMKSLLDLQPMRAVQLHRPTLNDVFIEVVERYSGETAAREAREGLRDD